jgi:hypothetical protein
VERTCPGWRVCVRVVSERENSLFSVAEKKRKKFTMPPRRERQSPDPEDRETREEEGDKHRIQKWKGRYVISERD